MRHQQPYRSLRIALLLILACNTSLSTAEQWEKLGSARAGISAEKVTFMLDGSVAFNKVRFRVNDGELMLRKANLYFAKDQMIMEGFQKRVYKGEHSRTIQLTNPRQQTLTKVDLFYKSLKQSTPDNEIHIDLMAVTAPN